MKVTVVIPVYNEAKEIGDCLASLSKQSFKNLEVIAVDDGSTDKTLSVLDSANYPNLNLKILRGQHKGAGAARNTGAKKASGEILVFVDADMLFEPDFIKYLVEPIVKGQAVGTFSKEEMLANKDNVWARCWNLNRGLPADRMHPKNYPDYQNAFRAILRSAFETAGGFDERAGYTDDWLSEKVGQKAEVAPGAVFYHKNPDSLKEVFDQSRWMAKRKYKWGSLGYFPAFLRVSLPASVVFGIFGSVYFLTPLFLIFKVVSDLGQFIGIWEYALGGKVAK